MTENQGDGGILKPGDIATATQHDVLEFTATSFHWTLLKHIDDLHSAYNEIHGYEQALTHSASISDRC